MPQLTLERLGKRKSLLSILWYCAAMLPQQSDGLEKKYNFADNLDFIHFRMGVIFFEVSVSQGRSRNLLQNIESRTFTEIKVERDK